MGQHIGGVALIVRDYDETITYYIDVLGFDLIEDTNLDRGKRWVLVRPPDGSETSLLLAKATTGEQLACVGDQTGGRVFLFPQADDFERDYLTIWSRGVMFLEAPRREAYGTVDVFRDSYGNKWD